MNSIEMSQLEYVKNQLIFEVARLQESNISLRLRDEKITDGLRSFKQHIHNELKDVENANKTIFDEFRKEHFRRMEEKDEELLHLARSSLKNVSIFAFHDYSQIKW